MNGELVQQSTNGISVTSSCSESIVVNVIDTPQLHIETLCMNTINGQ